ncbi:MAG TPA: alpha/beta hydrolase [Rhizomicrobium sp.]|jgi:acetyl esterase/lipase
MNRTVLFVLCAAAAIGAFGAAAAPISFSDLLSRPRPAPTKVASYGPDKLESGELFLPTGAGPHPVVVLIHGGCWLAELPGTELMDYIAADLQKRGFAVWNVEYRREGNPGGGYPGTFLDIANGLDALRGLAPANHLDLRKVVVVGHSAGGHLALWAAARAHLPKTSLLYKPNPLPIAGVVSLAGIPDLADYRANGPTACGGPSTIDRLVGPGTHQHPDVYADTSPASLLPIGVKQVIVSGSLDHIVPERFGHDYAAKARAAGDGVRVADMDGAGHFELIDPTSDAWSQIEAGIAALAR